MSVRVISVYLSMSSVGSLRVKEFPERGLGHISKSEGTAETACGGGAEEVKAASQIQVERFRAGSSEHLPKQVQPPLPFGVKLHTLIRVIEPAIGAMDFRRLGLR